MAYITVSNYKKVIARLDENKLDKIEGQVYKKKIFFFSTKERALLKGIKLFLEDIEAFYMEYYEPIVAIDSLKYLYPESQPSYHTDKHCERLRSSFRNFLIPPKIQEKGKDEVDKFRKWFREDGHNFIERIIFPISPSIKL